MDPYKGYSGKFKDDLTRQVLKDELVLKARAFELALLLPPKGFGSRSPKGVHGK